jgi:hypothetical protein
VIFRRVVIDIFFIEFTSTFESEIYHPLKCQQDELDCGRCLWCFCNWSLSSTQRDWAVLPARARFLRNKRIHF